jgi:hypothetical protein
MRLPLFLPAAISLLMTYPVHAELPLGWRMPTAKELGDDIDWRKEDPNRYLSVSGDFDGDKKQDSAQLLVNDARNSMALFVMLSSNSYKPSLLDEIADKRMITVMGVALAKPAYYKTACGKGYYKCGKNEPENIRLKNPAIDYFKESSANSFFVWQPRTRRFVRLWMSD